MSSRRKRVALWPGTVLTGGERDLLTEGAFTGLDEVPLDAEEADVVGVHLTGR